MISLRTIRAWPLAAILLIFCAALAIETNKAQPAPRSRAALDATRTAPRACVELGDRAQRRACGTEDAQFEYVFNVDVNRVTAVGLGARAPEVFRNIVAVNRDIADVRASAPGAMATVLRVSADDLRQRAIRVCVLEGRPATPGDSIRTSILQVYVWTEYRRALIARNNRQYLGRVGSLLNHPCFRPERELFFAGQPRAFRSAAASVYSLPGYFAHSLSYYHRALGHRLVSDAYAFRAILDESGNERLSYLEHSFDAGRSTLGSPKSRLWDICLRVIGASGSCVQRARQCSQASENRTTS